MKITYDGDNVAISDFKPGEAYRIARRLELEGMNFYNLLKSAVSDSGTKGVLEAIIAEEQRHFKLFDGKVEEVSGPFEEGSIVDEVDTGVFGSFGTPDDLASAVTDQKKALELGILFEMRSISFFEACLANSTDKFTAKAFSEVINEENGHAGKLKELLKRMKGE